MLRQIIIIISMLHPCLSLASTNYQVDLIIFAQPQNASKNNETYINAPIIPVSKHALALGIGANKSNTNYQLLSPLKSKLRDTYYLLNRTHKYQMLGHYSWIQPRNSNTLVALPLIDKSGWQMQGTVKIKYVGYYSLDAQLQLSPPSNPLASTTITQKQRLNGNTTYYLDNSQLGMIVKIHQPS